MLGSNDTAATQQGYFVPPSHLHKRLVRLTDEVKYESSIFAFTMVIGCKMENPYSVISVLDEPL